MRGGAGYDIDTCPEMCMLNLEGVRKRYEEVYGKSVIFTKRAFEEALDNALTLAASFKTLAIDTSPKMPKFPNCQEIIKQKAFEGLEICYAKSTVRHKKIADKQAYVDRLEYELDNVIRAGFGDYFLFLEDMCSWCHQNGVLLGPGRGSGAGSLRLYCLGITDVDPLFHHLLFERFLDAARLDEIISKGEQISAGDLPDVDIDFSNRDKVKAYLIEKYGEKNTCTIGTVGRRQNRSVLINLGKIHDVPLDEVQEASKDLTPEEDDMELDELKEKMPGIARLFKKFPKMEGDFIKLRGTISNWGKHAGGVLVSNVELTDMLPVRKVDDVIVTCWTEGIASRELGMMGFVKMDLLGVDAMNIVQDIIDMIRQTHPEFTSDMNKLPLENYDALASAANCDLMGVFQFDSDVAIKVIKAMEGIKTFNDLVAVTALMRPAALQNKFPAKFGKRRTGEEQYYLPPCLEPYLGSSYGLPLFQEAAYHVATHLAGFDRVKAYKFMKLLYKGKMTKDKVPEWQEKFTKGCQPKVDSGEIPKAYVEQIFTELLAFQGYGFNESHALSYTYFSTWQLYLKSRYLAEYVCVNLNAVDRSDQKKGVDILDARVKYALKRGLLVKKPDINKSQAKWSIESADCIRAGIGHNKGVGAEADNFIKLRPPEGYKSVENFLRITGCGKSRFEALLFAGCFDNLWKDRVSLYNWFYNDFDKKAAETNMEQPSLFAEPEQKKNEKTYTNEELAKAERDMNGFNIPVKLKILCKDYYEAHDEVHSISDVKKLKRMKPNVLAQVVSYFTFQSKRGGEYAKISLSDGDEDLTLIMSKDMLELKQSKFQLGNIINIPVSFRKQDDGTVDMDSCFFNDREELKHIGSVIGKQV